MPQWIRVANASELMRGEPKLVDANGTSIVLYDVEGALYATGSRCAHQGGPLGDGVLSGTTIMCPWHAWQFDVCSGESVFDPEFRVRTFPVKVEEGSVFVAIEPEVPVEPGGASRSEA